MQARDRREPTHSRGRVGQGSVLPRELRSLGISHIRVADASSEVTHCAIRDAVDLLDGRSALDENVLGVHEPACHGIILEQRRCGALEGASALSASMMQS